MASAPLLVRAGTLPGRLVVILQDGAVLGIVRRAVEDPFTGRLLGFAFEDDEWYEGPKFLPHQAVVGFGENALILEERHHILQLHQAAEIRLILKQRETFLEKHVMTEDGRYLGEIFDFDFDREGYTVHYYLHRLLAGEATCALLPAERTLRVGRHLVLVADGQLTPTEVQPTVRAPWSVVKEPRVPASVKGLLQLRPQRSVAEIQTSTHVESASERFQKREHAYYLGRLVERDIRTDDGTLLIARGQQIDQDTLDRALAAGKFMELAISSRTSDTAFSQTTEKSRVA